MATKLVLENHPLAVGSAVAAALVQYASVSIVVPWNPVAFLAPAIVVACG